MKKEFDRKAAVEAYFKLIMEGKFTEGLRFFAPDCKTHNPYIKGSVGVLTDAMAKAGGEMGSGHPNIEFTVRQVIADGDLVAVHTQMLYDKSKPGEGGTRQAHIFRFEGEKIVEYWDITQEILPKMPNAAGAF